MNTQLRNRPDILNLIENVALEQGLPNFKIIDLKKNDKGEGFLSQVYLITIRDSANDKRLDIVVKASFTNEKTSGAIPKSGENEIYFYSKVYETFKKFQQDRGIEQLPKFLPNCFKTYLSKQHQLLCLENLRKAGFETIDKREVLDHDHVSMIFKTYGKFHAISYALRDQQPEKFNEFSDGLYNMYKEFINDEVVGFSKSLKVFSKLAFEHLVPGEDDVIIKKMEKYMDGGIVESLMSIIEEKNDFFCITHGDCWSNNMMFKYEKSKSGKKLVDLRLLDLQFSKLGSPACDLSYCLYSGSSKVIFDNLNTYLELYYKSFSSFLKKLGSDPEKVFPFDVLKDHWRKYSKFGMFMAIMILKMKVTEKDEVVDFTDALETEELVDTFLRATFDRATYQRQIRELLQHMSDWDLL